MSVTELPDPEALSLEMATTLLNEYQLRAQRREEMSDEELRHATRVLARVRSATSTAAASRRGRAVAPAAPISLDSF